MGLEVGRLAVHFAASWDVAAVNVALAQMSARWTETVRLLAVGAVTCSTARVSAR